MTPERAVDEETSRELKVLRLRDRRASELVDLARTAESAALAEKERLANELLRRRGEAATTRANLDVLSAAVCAAFGLPEGAQIPDMLAPLASVAMGRGAREGMPYPAPPPGFTGVRGRVVGEAVDGAHVVRLAEYAFPDGSRVPYAELHETHDGARPGRVMSLSALVHLAQNASNSEVWQIGGREGRPTVGSPGFVDPLPSEMAIDWRPTVGARVVTASPLTANYPPGYDRRGGAFGALTDEHEQGGWWVRHDDGTAAPYDADELRPVPSCEREADLPQVLTDDEAAKATASAPIPPGDRRPAVTGGECARCFARPPYHEATCPTRAARGDGGSK